MNTFHSSDGVEWSIEIDTSTLIRLRKEHQIDLMEVIDGPLLNDLYADPEKLINVLIAIMQPELDFNEFASVMGGKSLDDAHDALMAALLAFFPKAHRETLEAVLRTSREGQAKVISVLNGPAVGQAMTAELDKLESDLLRELAQHGNGSTS